MNSATCSALCWLSVTSPATQQRIGPFWCLFPGTRFVYILGSHGSLQQTLLWNWEFFPLPPPPQVITARGFEALFPCARTLVCTVSVLPCCSSQFFHTRIWDRPICQPPPCCASCLPVFAPPANLDECFFFNSLFVGLPYSSIF